MLSGGTQTKIHVEKLGLSPHNYPELPPKLDANVTSLYALLPEQLGNESQPFTRREVHILVNAVIETDVKALLETASEILFGFVHRPEAIDVLSGNFGNWTSWHEIHQGVLIAGLNHTKATTFMEALFLF